MQKEILEKYPQSQVRVYAIWLPILGTDKRNRWKWTAGVLHDSRVIHLWDGEKAIGQGFGKQLAIWQDEKNDALLDDDAVWDTFFIYSAGTTWTENAPKPISWGSTIDSQQEKLKEHIFPLLTK